MKNSGIGSVDAVIKSERKQGKRMIQANLFRCGKHELDVFPAQALHQSVLQNIRFVVPGYPAVAQAWSQAESSDSNQSADPGPYWNVGKGRIICFEEVHSSEIQL